MKRTLAFLLASAVLLFFCVASAEEIYCDKHPHDPLESVSSVGRYDPQDENSHLSSWYSYKVCSVCGESVGTGAAYLKKYELHVFLNNKCMLCGYLRSDSGSDDKNFSASDGQQAAGYQDDQDVVGAIAQVVYAGNVRMSASIDATVAGKVYVDETYVITGYTTAGNGSVWLQIEYGTQKGWVSAGLVEILYYDSGVGGEMSHLIGQSIVVKAGSGNARSAPGSASSKVGIVVRGEQYTILDCGHDQSGQLWYMISLNGGDAWISSGIVNLQ